jgi:hypothetical protein
MTRDNLTTEQAEMVDRLCFDTCRSLQHEYPLAVILRSIFWQGFQAATFATQNPARAEVML